MWGQKSTQSPTAWQRLRLGIANGANLVGFTYATGYVAGTIGRWLEDLALSTGASFIGWARSGVGALTLSVRTTLRETVSVSGYATTADLLTGLNALVTEQTEAVLWRIPRGTWTLSDSWTFTGERLNLRGDGRQVTIVSFTPGATKAALTVNKATAGGSNQGAISGLGFTSGDSSVKTAIRLVNVANYEVGHIGIATGAWLGDSIGIKTEGRQLIHLHDMEIGCNRPFVCGNNATFPTISNDHSVFERLELIGNSAAYPVMEFESGTSFGNLTISNFACVKGSHGIYWNDTTSTSASFCLKIDGFRSEQGLDAAAYSIYLASTAQALQNVIIENALLDSARNGIFLRNAQRVTMRNVTFNMSAGTALDMTFVAGSSLILENCSKQPGSAFTLTNARCVRRERVGNIGFIEEWVYDSGFSAGGVASDVYHGGTQFTVANTATTPIADNTFCGLLFVTSSEDVSAVFEIRGPSNTTRELLDNANFFSQTAGTVSSVNIYWDAGSSRYLLQNNRGAPVIFSVYRIGSVI